MNIKSYVELVRFRYHFTFISVVIGALLFGERFQPQILVSLAILYVSFNIFLYGGLYGINAIADIESDKNHPLKRKRPLPSGRVSITPAFIFSVLFVLFGLITGYLYFRIQIFYFFIAFVAANLFYTFVAKKVAYLELFINSVTHSLRFAMGVTLANGKIQYTVILAVFMLAFGISTARRIYEKKSDKWNARQTLSQYFPNGFFIIKCLPFAVLAILLAIDYPMNTWFYAAIMAVYGILIFFGMNSKKAEKIMSMFFLK